jgi:hypothetical protein
MINSEDVYEALEQQLKNPWGYISGEFSKPNFASVVVDGTIDCQEIAKFLNERNKN